MRQTVPVSTGPKRRPQRRERILQEAVELFRRDGFTDTGIDDIGAAAGITGPGVYRHFESKQQILEEATRQASERVLRRAHEIVEQGATPEEALERLADQLAGSVVESPALVAVLHRERRNLGRTARATMDRAYRLYVEEWVHAITQLRPDLDDGEARAAAHGILGIAFSVAQFDSGLDRERLATLLRTMILGAVHSRG